MTVYFIRLGYNRKKRTTLKGANSSTIKVGKHIANT